jgi:predicted AAA+ superfamily ATPase
VHVIATGSCALSLGSGSRESLAGRFERLSLLHWSASALVDAFGIETLAAVDAVVRLGSYPGAFGFRADERRWAAYMRDAIVEPAIGRDILALGPVRKPALLRQVFSIAASSPAQIVALKKLQGQLQDKGALETIAHYLHLLAEAYLIAPLEKFSEKELRARAAPPKLIALSNALPAIVDSRGPPHAERESDRFGAWVENACLAFAWNEGQRVRYWREEPLEVDGILDGTWGTWAVEVKTGRVESVDLGALGEFTRRFPRYRPVVLGDERSRATVERAKMVFVPWQEFLLKGPKALPHP